jgi:hypothetical protein
VEIFGRMICRLLVGSAVVMAGCAARGQATKAAYPVMAPLEQYLIADEAAESALAPASISADAEVMVLRRDGYATVAKGKNGFVCIVERSWGKATDDPEFWNQKMRAPHCFNAAGARSFLPIYLMKTKLVLAGRSKAEILKATTAALDTKELPPVEAGAMAYMMSRQQYLSDRDKSWHPHYMIFLPGDIEKSWGAEFADSPVMMGNDPEERVSIVMSVADKWSDGTAVEAMKH